MQFKAGYIIDSVAKVVENFKADLDENNISEQTQLLQIGGLLQHVSSFDVEFPYEYQLDYKNLNPVISTINNIVSRGLPTKAPVLLEKVFSNIGLTKQKESAFELDFPRTTKTIDFKSIFELLHIVEPDLDINRAEYGGFPGSLAEWNFLDKKLQKFPFAKQIFQSQRDFSTIDTLLAGGRTLDFSYEFPYLNPTVEGLKDRQRQGIIFEFDGPHHKIQTVKYYDRYRDEVADLNGFNTLRQSYDTTGLNLSIENQFRDDIFEVFKTNYNRKIEDYLFEYSLIFIPLAVARIQKTIIELLLSNPSLFEKDKVEVAIVERDLPCGAIALKSLQEFFLNINAILEEEDKFHFPEFSLTIFESKRWVIDKKLHLDAEVKDEKFFYENQFDIVIDHSILRRSNIYNETDFKDENAIKVRSSHYFDTSFGNSRRVYCANLLHYKALVSKEDDGSYTPIKKYEANINFFIQNIFRKVAFRDGQLPIISRALQQKPVIGLLPTGGGKSLAFQLPAFLQPGLCLIVDPIKSLMEDQVRVLKEGWIDCCDFINSNLTTKEKAKRLIDFRYGEIMFFFVAPERLIMEDFRTIISKIDTSDFGLAFSYCVIDEVHCVSEWGHSFRSTYLMLGKNAQKFAVTKTKKPISLIGLTATASFDVLADIEREIQIKHDDVADAIIMIENTIRPELFFRVIDITKENRITALNNDFQKVGKNLAKINTEELLKRSQKHHFDNFSKKDFANKATKNLLDENKMEFEYNSRFLINEPLEDKTQNDFYSIVFAPFRGENGNKKGVDFIYEHLESDSKGFYYSADKEEQNKKIQQHFKDFTTDKTQHIICTKAFGMGIDKKDIRSTYHYVYSSSLESLIQESGRSGRDKQISEANILVSTAKYTKFDIFKFFRENSQHRLLRNKFTRKALRAAFFQRWNGKGFDEISFISKDEIKKTMENADFSLLKRNGDRYNILNVEDIKQLQTLMLEEHNGAYAFIIEKYEDRGVHEYFYKKSFKGIDTEKSQLLNVFKIPEFKIIKNEFILIDGQDTLMNEFNNCNDKYFSFIITQTKKGNKASEHICQWFGKAPEGLPYPKSKKTYKKTIEDAHEYSEDFQDFLFLLEEKNVIPNLNELDKLIEDELLFLYGRDRESQNETGRLIYRMHSIGFLEDYLIDYNRKLYNCTFRKYKSIDNYIKIIEDYLRRYLSEQTAIEKIIVLKQRLSNSSLIEDILECLNFLAEFSYEEIASKQVRATDEIEEILNKSVLDKKYATDWFEQNLYIKEQIYFYFNAKYARVGFKINGKPYSLLDDYKDSSKTKGATLDKYLDVFELEGTEQNNYKHMMGSCKKMLRSLSDTDLKREWLLRLLKAFSMYSVNNDSYTSEANSELEKGFIKLYEDEKFHQNDYKIIEPIFTSYFEKLEKNIQKDNQSFKDIKLIRAKILIQMQVLGLENIILKNNQLTAKNNYA
jgi:ATP-dependent DNA helicase RecQ